MKKLLLFILLVSSFAASAQSTHPGYSPKVNSYGNTFQRTAGDSAVHIPNKNLSLNDNDTTPQLAVINDSLRGYWNGNWWNFGHGNGTGGSSYTADETTIHLSGSQFQIKSTWVGQTSIITVGNLSTGSLTAGFTPVADAQIASSSIWNNKQTSVLSSALIWVGNGSNIATPVTPSGDLSINNTGVFTLVNTAVTAGSYTSANITVDSKGRITSAANGSGSGSTPFPDNTPLIKNSSDNTKQAQFSSVGITTGTTRTFTFPDANGQLTLDANTTTLTNKTIAAGSNTITGIANANLSGTAGIANANLNSMSNNTVKGNVSGGTATPSDLTGTQVASMLPTASTSQLGLVKVDGTTVTITAGVISSTGGGGSPGGANTNVQFNSSSVFGGSSHLTWDNSSNLLTTDSLGVTKSITVVRSGEAPFSIAQRVGFGFTFPVISVRSMNTNNGTVLDIMPNGTASDNGNNGISWFDICNVDFQWANPAGSSLRLGMGSTWGEVGVRSWNGAPKRQLHFTNDVGTKKAQLDTTGVLEADWFRVTGTSSFALPPVAGRGLEFAFDSTGNVAYIFPYIRSAPGTVGYTMPLNIDGNDLILNNRSGKSILMGSGTGSGTDHGIAKVEITCTGCSELGLFYNATTNTQFQVGSDGHLAIVPSGVNVAFTAPTASHATITLPAGTTVTSPNQGDLWGVTGHLYYRDQTTTYDLLTGGGGGMSNPMTTLGDMIVGGSGGSPVRVPVAAHAGMKLTSISSGIGVAWEDSTAGGGGGMAIGGAVTSGTSGSILYVNSSNQLAQDNSNFFYDATNKAFDLGTNTTGTSTVVHIVSAGFPLKMEDNTGTSAAYFSNYQTDATISVNYHPYTGVFKDVNKAGMMIQLDGSASSSTLRFYGSMSNNTSPGQYAAFWGNGNVIFSTATGADQGTGVLQIYKNAPQLALMSSGSSYTQFQTNNGILFITPTSQTVQFTGSAASGASVNIPNGSAPTTPNDGDIWKTTTHIYARINTTTYQLDQQSGSSQTLDQVLNTGSTLTANRTIVNAGFNLAMTGTGKFLLGTSTDNNLGQEQILGTGTQVGWLYDATHYVTLQVGSSGTGTFTPSGGSMNVAGSWSPTANNTYDLGGSGNSWNNAWIKNITISGFETVSFSTHSGNYTVAATDVIVQFTAGATCTMPTSTGNAGRVVYIKNTSSGNITLSGMASGETTLMSIAGTSGASGAFYSDGAGAGWRWMSYGE